MKFTTLLGCLILTIYSFNIQAADEKEVQKAVQQAKQAFDEAVKAQGGWVTTKKLITSAELSATKGDRDKALELANQAKHEAQLSLQQALNQQKNWTEPGYLK